MAFDNICKYLSETYPASFVNWLFGTTPKTIEVLKTELTIEAIRADFVAFLGQQRMMQIEFQVKGESEFQLEGTRHCYQVVKMWEQDPEPFLQDQALLPLAVLCAAENSTQLLSRAAEEISKIEKPEQ